MDESLLKFLDAGDAPIAFTPGSAMAQGQLFFAAAVDACRRLGRRGILLTRQSGQVPADLPPSMIHVRFAPFSELLPRCAALVHHGGIGTTSQALRAGTPQLVMAMAHDQLDNADRAVKLGVAATIKRRKFTGRNVARALAALLAKPGLCENCVAVASRFVGHDALAETAAAIEQMRRAEPAAVGR
jgi:UDP:flavonoid glycosyltransferase YjiC (YdhE family)